MSRIAYVNGCYLPMRSAAVHIEDRGYQFGDGVYDAAWPAATMPSRRRKCRRALW
jgi:hypothetical protein